MHICSLTPLGRFTLSVMLIIFHGAEIAGNSNFICDTSQVIERKTAIREIYSNEGDFLIFSQGSVGKSPQWIQTAKEKEKQSDKD